MRRSHFAVFLAAIASFFAAVLRIPFIDHRTHLDLQGAAVDAKSPTMLKCAKAFVSRAFAHDRYSGGSFDLARSTIA